MAQLPSVSQAAQRSATIIVGRLVFAAGINGMIEPSITETVNASP